MDFETAIQTQRNALLRLLAGWLAVIVLLSVAPISSAWDRRVRRFLFAVLRRAESAAQCLSIAQARLMARRIGEAGPVCATPRFACLVPGSDADEPPSLAELRARLLALRYLLKNLPRRGMRLLRRAMTRRSVSLARSGAQAVAAVRRLVRVQTADQCAPGSLWHPPKRADAFLSCP